MTHGTSLKRLLTTMSVAVACLTPLNSAAQATSTIAGCITDTIGQPLAGVTVDVGGDGRHRIVQTDARGCGFLLAPIRLSSSLPTLQLGDPMPEGGSAEVIRRGTFTCEASGCSFILIPTGITKPAE